MIEHINIIECYHSQIEALLDLMQCSDHGSVDTRSMATAAEMCQTMMDEVMSEFAVMERKWRDDKHELEDISTLMCDKYCKWPIICESQDELLSYCNECPLAKRAN